MDARIIPIHSGQASAHDTGSTARSWPGRERAIAGCRAAL